MRPGSIGNDLARRDFSVNAMAVPIANIANSAASILDPYGGRADLAAGVIRILHPQSFRDDPTRILRAARYARRFAFRIADDTLTQLRAALAGGAMDTLTGDRVRHELERILQEPRPLAALRYAGELGALAAIHPALSVAHLRHLPPDTPAAPLTWLAALVWPLGPAQGNALAGRLNAPAGWSRVIDDTAELAARLPRLAAPGLPPSASCARLDGLSPPRNGRRSPAGAAAGSRTHPALPGRMADGKSPAAGRRPVRSGRSRRPRSRRSPPRPPPGPAGRPNTQPAGRNPAGAAMGISGRIAVPVIRAKAGTQRSEIAQ